MRGSRACLGHRHPPAPAVSEAVADDGQNPRYIAEHQRGIPDGTSPPGSARSNAPLALAIRGR